MNQDDRNMALEINAMLMAFHSDDFKTMQTILSDIEEPADLLLGGLAVSLSMVDELITFIRENIESVDFTFEDLIRVRGHYLTDLDNGL